MSIVVAKTAGFCYGVKRAVNEVYDRALKKEEHIATLGKLIHNRQVVEDLEKMGVKAYDCVEDVPEGVRLVIRTHGVAKDVIEKIEKKNISYVDLTCPFVEKIHKIVKEYYEKGYKIVIIGDGNHPEVQGINGWCNNEGIIVYSCDEAILDKISEKRVCIVAQTTINRENFEQVIQFIKKTCQGAVVFDTICNATKDRQSETLHLAEESDIMIVVGGKESSNTRKLYEISRKRCPLTFHIETFEDLPQNINYKNKKIGITAGASTPSRIIEEVFTVMDEMTRNEQGMDFAQMIEESIKTLNTGDVVTGTVVEVRNNEVIVDLGFKSDGILAADQLTDDPYLKPSDIVKVGDQIDVFIVGVNDAEGKTVLSRKRLVAMENWKKIKEAYESKTILEGKVIQVVKGGVIALTEGNKVFIPARQASERFIQDLSTLLNANVKFRIIELDEKRKRVIGSVRSVLEEERKGLEEKFWASAEVGKEYTGTVKSVTAFGAFVDIGGVDGLVHISELSWSKIKHPSEIVKEGDVLTVYIKDINKETKKIALGYKKQEDNPWLVAQAKYNVGDVVSCKIVRMVPFGAFAEIIPNVDGLIHISQISDKRIGKPEDVLSIGQVVDAKITDLNWENKKISLSIKALIAPAAEAAEEAHEEAAEESIQEQE
ncbi:MAG: bifunctional 4-hydroxy-3-methylbut-2-enyl diphosphate reductase/30S ribosomal protein S1 [Clostridia bacterium]|nr:bifunctional 4-hydroxy-3-methylbut-2-enyl diphosphate reductase/30S ribosomal protein S1 [Clostridia bacterium]